MFNRNKRCQAVGAPNIREGLEIHELGILRMGILRMGILSMLGKMHDSQSLFSGVRARAICDFSP